MRHLLLTVVALGFVLSADALAQQRAEKSNMELVGSQDLQARSAYQPVIHKQGNRWIAYVGHHGGMALNPLTGKQEPNGTSIVDVTEPKQPKYLAHIAGEPGGAGEAGGAQMVRLCNGSDLPRADKNKVYLLRSYGTSGHEIWDVTDPAKPSRVTVVVSGLHDTHKSWWECDTGIAFIVSGPPDWRTRRMTKIYDLSDPAEPSFIRDFGLPGQQPGSTGAVPTDLHGPFSTGPKGNRVYFGYGTGANGIVQILDREKLLKGPKEPTEANLLYPQIARIDLPGDAGAHTAFPMLDMQLPEFANQKLRPGGAPAAAADHDHDDPVSSNRTQARRDFIAVVGETTANECFENRQMVRMFDITIESKPVGISTWTVPETRISRRSITSACCSSRISTPACAPSTSAILSIRRKLVITSRPSTARPINAASAQAQTSAARWPSRRIMSKWMTGATSISWTGPTPACTSSS